MAESLPQFLNFLLVFAPVFNYYKVLTLFKTFKNLKREKKVDNVLQMHLLDSI